MVAKERSICNLMAIEAGGSRRRGLRQDLASPGDLTLKPSNCSPFGRSLESGNDPQIALGQLMVLRRQHRRSPKGWFFLVAIRGMGAYVGKVSPGSTPAYSRPITITNQVVGVLPVLPLQTSRM